MLIDAGLDVAPMTSSCGTGGNNDFPFFAPDLPITVTDPLRPGHELRYHPGEVNLRMADVVVINKVDSAGCTFGHAGRHKRCGGQSAREAHQGIVASHRRAGSLDRRKACLGVETDPRSRTTACRSAPALWRRATPGRTDGLRCGRHCSTLA
jgi:hypothetical protein